MSLWMNDYLFIFKRWCVLRESLNVQVKEVGLKFSLVHPEKSGISSWKVQPT